MATNNNSISNLFGSYNATGMSSLFADYNSIKNGSYGKLLKSYYNIDGKSTRAGSSKSSSSDVLSKILEEKKNPTVSKEVKEANSSLSTGISNVKTSIANLQKDSTYEDTDGGSAAQDKVTSAVKDFVKNYNSVVSSSKKSTNTGMTSNVSDMMKATNANKSDLAAIGVSVNSDGTLTVNENKLKSANISDVQKLFSPDDKVSYGSRLAGRAASAGYYGGDTSIQVSSVDAERIDKASTNASDLKSAAQALTSNDLYAKVKDADGKETDKYDVDAILSKAKDFVKNYNESIQSAAKLTNSGVAANLGNILNATKKNADALGQIGITVGQGGALSINEETFKNADGSKLKSALKDYASSVSTYSSLVDYYSSTQASASDGYLSNGAYNTQAMSSFGGTM